MHDWSLSDFPHAPMPPNLQPPTHSSRRECSCFLLRRLSRTVSRLYDAHLEAVGLKTTQFSVLNTIARKAVAVSELAALLGLERSSLSRNIKPLLARGLIEIAPEGDRRLKPLRLTNTGQALLKDARMAWRDAQLHFEQTLGSQFTAEFHGDVHHVQRQIGALVEDGSRAAFGGARVRD